MTRKLFVMFAFILMLGSVISYAQVRGAIEGTVTDDNGDPLPGVVVKAEAPALLQPRYYTTDENGRYRLIELPPGKGYTLEFRMMGFQTILRTDLEVLINRISQVDIQLKEVAFEEQVVITGAAPVLDTTSSTSGVNIDRDFTERLPGSDNYQSSLSMQGGSTGSGNVRVRGGQRHSNLYMFDGVDTTDPLTGTFGANLNADAVAETEVMTGGMPAEFGRVSGGVINTVTKSGGNDFSGSLRIKYYDPSWILDSDYYDKPGGSTRFEPTVSLGGPIMRDKLWFFFTYRRITIKGDQTVRRRSWATGEYEEIVWDRDELWQFMYAKLTWSLNPEHQIFLTWNSDPMVSKNEGLGASTLSEQTLGEWQQGGNTYGINWTWIVNQNLFIETKVGIGRQDLNIKANSMENDITVYHPDSSLSAIRLGSLGYSYETDRDRDSFDISAKYFMSDVKGNHEWKTGFAYHSMIGGGGYWYPDESLTIYLNEDYVYDEYGPWDDPIYWTEETTRTIRYDQVMNANEADYYAFYVQDKWRPDFIDGFTANIGVRFESHEGYNNLGEKVFSHGFFDMIAPRVGFVWDMGNTGRHKFNVFWGRFYTVWSTMVANIAEHDTSWSQTYHWNPETFDWELTSETSPEDPTGFIDPDIKPEYTDEFTIGYERELSSNWAAGISYTRKISYDMAEDYMRMYDADGNIVWDGPGSEDLGVSDTYIDRYYYVYTNIADAKRDYWGVELFTTAKLRNLTLIASYTLSESKGSVMDINEGFGGITYTTADYDIPELCENLYGFTQYHIKHYFKVNASYMFSWGTSLGISGIYRSGYRHSRLRRPQAISGVPGYSGSYYAISEEGRGAYELPWFYFIDMSLQHDFHLGKFGKLTLIGDVYNITNNQGVLGRERRDIATFGEDTAWMSPMNWQVSMLYQF